MYNISSPEHCPKENTLTLMLFSFYKQTFDRHCKQTPDNFNSKYKVGSQFRESTWMQGNCTFPYDWVDQKNKRDQMSKMQ